MRPTLKMMIAAGTMMLPGTALAAGPECPAGCTKECCDTECSSDCVKACCVNLAEMVDFEFAAPDLFIGDDAPEMKIAQFIKGESVDAFEEGKVYVVEFWATWCGPCIAAFPHISELQKGYGDKVQVVGVNIWDRQQNRSTGEFTESQGDWVQRVSEFVDGQGDKMGYTVALEEDTYMQENWMRAGGRNGIPSAFIVDGKGKIAWVGHPMQIDAPLEAAVNGEINYEDAIQAAKNEQLLEKAYMAAMPKLQSAEKAEAEVGYTIAHAMAMQLGSDNAGLLNALAWPVLDDTSPIVHRDYEFALELGKKAAEITKFEDPMILDTYATALFKTGDIKGAIEHQKNAVELVKSSEQFSSMTGEFEARLAEFEAAG